MNREELLKWHKTLEDLNKCGICGQVKAISDFQKPRTYKDKQYWYCKKCAYKYNRKKALAKFGLTVEKYNELLERQNGACAICEQVPNKRKLAIDHNHINGKVRGLLCSSCKFLLGLVRDCPELLQKAADYIKSGN